MADDGILAADSLRSVEHGLGTERDKAAAHTFYEREKLTRQELDALYASNWMATKAVEIPAMDSVRAWRNWQAKDDAIEQIEAEETRLNLRGKLLEALTASRLYGGGALVMGTGKEDGRTPLDLKRIGKGDLKFLHVMNRYELMADKLRLNPLDPWFGEPEVWKFATEMGGFHEVHPSRVIAFPGRRAPGTDISRQDPWGDSILQAMADALRDAGLAQASIANLLVEAKQDIIKIPRLMSHLSSQDYAKKLTERLRTAMRLKSLVNTLVLDSEEDFEQKQISFSQLPETLQKYLVIGAASAGMPVTLFLSQSPGGLNATGESDLRNYYDRLGAEQALVLTPKLSRLDEVLIRSATGERNPGIHYAWAPLWQTSEKEGSEIEKNRAEAFAKLGASGLLPDQVVSKVLVNTLTESGRYPGIEQAMDAYEAEVGEFDPSAGDPAEEEEEDESGDEAGRRQAAADAAPRTLYVHRRVLNGSAILKWARAQGFRKTLKASDLHVTIIYSRTPLDWMKVGAVWQSRLEVPEGGPRLMEQFGEARVLLFKAAEIEWRHEDMKRAGATHDYPEFQPHITISHDPGSPSLTEVEPYQGKIVLGPEVFAEIDEDWQPEGDGK